MYSYNDFERLFVRYKAEPVPSGISIHAFCESNKVPYKLFKMMVISQLEYLKNFYSAIVEERDDFENLHPAAIALNLNK